MHIVVSGCLAILTVVRPSSPERWQAHYLICKILLPASNVQFIVTQALMLAEDHVCAPLHSISGNGDEQVMFCEVRRA